MSTETGRIVSAPVEELHSGPDVLTDREDKLIDRQRRSEETKKLRLKNRELKQNISERKIYADRVYWLVGTFLVALFTLVLAQGWSAYTGFRIQNNVLIALITGATANVVGLFIVVVKYLFPKVSDSV
ncbi:MAG: hypothetical protein OXU79_08910 [Gemmatimonadota bacterium]|nr:hypothetical protein [Gemmatimonadota bacterium]